MSTKPPPKFEVKGYTEANAPVPASPSASIILVAPDNRILLLSRRKTSSAFPSAHVFPGGNLDPSDGYLDPNPTSIHRHVENLTYRTGAIRELFEETGILLAKASATATSLITVSDSARQAGRLAVHSQKVSFLEWLESQHPGAVLHTEGLIPFTHWITPPNVPKRFTTQMYVYFVHLKETGNPSVRPSSDEVETMAPEYRTAREWLSAARGGEVILFPPQFILLHLISEYLDVEEVGKAGVYGRVDAAEVVARRRRLYEFITTDKSPVVWGDKYISPIGRGTAADGRSILQLGGVGPELKGSGLVGDESRVVLVQFQKEGPRKLEVRMKKDVLDEISKGKPEAKGKI